jgi:hypothetical protein
MTSPSTEHLQALQDEVATLIAEAMKTQVVLPASAHAARLAETYRLCGMTKSEICALLVGLAAPAKVALVLAED